MIGVCANDRIRVGRVQVLLPLPIGLAVFVVHLATIPITGTGINPARSLGAAVMYNKAWSYHVRSEELTRLLVHIQTFSPHLTRIRS